MALVALAAIIPVTGAAPADADAARPERIISLAPTPTEMLFAIGAGSQVVAVDDQSNFPKRAPVTDLSGYTPNIEAIAGYQPDLVVVTDTTAVDQLDAIGIDTLVLAGDDVHGLRDVYAQLRRLGKATGHVAGARKVIAGMKADVADLVDQVPSGERPSSYYELDDTYFSADSSTFIGQMLKLGGFTNIADEAESDGSGYPQLSVEFLVDSNPDAIFLADTKCCGQSAATVAERPGFADLHAVIDDHIVELDDDIASRWGPRVVDLLRAIVKARTQL
jgi:iron complex transport system substrate-binding protein